MANTFDQFDNPVVSGARDVGTALTLGANDILGITGNVAKIVTGKDNFLTELAKKNAEALQLQKSPELIAAEQDRDEAVAAEPNLLYAIGTYVKKTASDPRLFTTTVAQTAPSSIGPGVVGAGAKMAAGKLLAKKGTEFATKVGLGTAIGTGVGMQAADVGGQQMDDLLRTLEGMDDQTAMQIPQVADLVKNKGYSIPEAKAAAASYVAMQTAFGAGAISALTQLVPGAQTIEKAIVGGTEKAAGKTLLSKVAAAGKGAVKGAVGETLQEVPEEGGGQYLANVLARQIEPERELTAGVAPAIGQAIVGAGTLGAIVGAKEGAPVSRQEPTPRPVPESEAPAGMSGEPPVPAATKPSLAPQQQATLERSEDMTSDQFWATVNIRQARLLGGEPNPEDVRLVGEVPPPRAVINPDVMNGALDEAYGALNDWRADNPNAPENIVLIFDPEMLHNGYGIQGAFNPKDGAIFINTAFVSPENIGKIVSHEWAHSTLATNEGRQALADFASREIPQADLDALATRYGTQDRLTLLEEWIAENQEKAPGVISRIVARIREWLSNFGIVNLNDREVADIMLRTLREQAENKVQPDVDQVNGPVEVDPNSEIYDQFSSDKLGAPAKFALQKLPTAADVTDAKGNLRYTIPKKTLDVSHYSFVPDLTEVDPAYYGTGRGEHYHRMMKGINKSFFFVGNSKPKAHENVAGKGMNRYRTTIDSSRIYDMDKDPLDLWFAPNPQKSEGLLKELGYDGFLAKTDDGRSFVALFYPTSLETGEVTRAAQPVEEAVSEEPQESAEEYLARVEREEAAERRKALRRASSGKYSLTQEQQPTSGVMASPSITDIDYQRAKKNLRSSEQARFKSEIADYAPGAEIYDAIGDWLDGAENSIAVVYDGPKPVDELKEIAAKAGISGRQKNILWWTADADGTDAIHQVFWPKNVSMDEARQAMIDAGLEARTLMQTPDGIRGLVFDQGRKNLNKIKVLHEHETEPSLDSHNATGDFLGTNWAEEREQRAPRAYGLKAYRGVLGRAAETETGPGRGGPEQRDDLLGRPETEKRFSLAQTKTPEFKAWFGDSQITTPEGTPQVMYHGTYSRKYFLNKFGQKTPVKPDQDFTVFKPSERRGGTIFVSPSPEFASKFAMDTQDLGKKTFFGTTPEELAEERPGARVYPVFVKSENPFDFENEEHVRRLFGDEEYIEVVPGSKDSDTSDIYGSVDYDGVASRRFDVEKGRWEAIENLTEQIKNAGFDGFYVWEEGVKNLGVFNPKQLVSATGNVGAFGQRPITAEEAQRLGMTEEEAAEEQRRGDIRFSLAQTKTPEFKRFFGDWDTNPDGASKVVDENGKPRILFHGTIAGLDFAGFNTKSSAAGSHFATIPAVASSFAKGFRGPTGSRVIPVYLNIRNPWRSRDLMDWSGTAVIKEWANQHGQTYEKVEQEFNRVLEEENAFSENDTRQVQLFLKSKGHDGIVYLNRYEVYAPGEENIPGERYARMSGARKSPTDEEFLRSVPEATDAWIAFDPEQIKSATGNVGAFGQRPVTAEEAQRLGMTEEEAAEAQKRGDIRMSLTEEPVEKTRTEEVEEPVLEEGDEGYEEPVDTSSILNAAAKREREELPPTSALNTLYAKQSAVPLPVTGKRTNGQVAEQLRQAAREYWGRELNSGNLTPDELDRIVGNAVEEVIAGLKAKNHAGNWYTTAIRKAMAIARVIHPELGDDALARKAGFDDAHAAEVGLAMAMAITSQNLNVEKNTEYANDQFNILKNTGRFDPSKEYGSKLEAISGNLQLANVLLDRVGWKGVEDFLNREYTVKQLNEIASEVLGKPVSISGKVDDVVNGSAIFGPKIGAGFFQNLRGNFNPVTVDLWMRRTWGRWTGDVLPEPLDANRLARMLVGMREGGIQLPEELRSIRTVIAKKGRKVPTLTEDTAERVLSNPEAVNAAYDFAALHDSRWNKIYSEVRQNITPEQAEAVRNGSMSLEQLNRQQQKSIREKQEAWQDLEDRPPVSTKEGKKAQEKFFEEMDREAGRTEKLSNKELSRFKPEWAKAARVIRTLLKPIDAPSDIDRRTIVDVVNRVRSELDRQGINATNADIQAILWYPEKDLWAKLAGKPESKLKSSYDEEFFRVAEARGLGEQARSAAAEVGN